MWSYDKRLQYPVKIKNPNPQAGCYQELCAIYCTLSQAAKIVISQLGGANC